MKILYLMSSANLFGGTPRKTLELVRVSSIEIFIYFWSDTYKVYQERFTEAGASVSSGDFGRNILKHTRKIVKIIDENDIRLIQTQFSIGELLAYAVKLLRPNVKIIVTFVGALNPPWAKRIILKQIYKKIDYFVYISKYVEQEKLSAFKVLRDKNSKIILNGSRRRKDNGGIVARANYFSLISVASLIDIKNLGILVEAIILIINKYNDRNIYLYIAGDGPLRDHLQKKITENKLGHNIFLLGHQTNIGLLLNQCEIYVHPSYAEGFGIAVVEAMMAEKPIIVSKAGALPELIEHEKSGLVVDPFNAEEWARSILKLKKDKVLALRLAQNARERAEREFSLEKYASNYQLLYRTILSGQKSA